jgi:hypothetical protein
MISLAATTPGGPSGRQLTARHGARRDLHGCWYDRRAGPVRVRRVRGRLAQTNTSRVSSVVPGGGFKAAPACRKEAGQGVQREGGAGGAEEPRGVGWAGRGGAGSRGVLPCSPVRAWRFAIVMETSGGNDRLGWGLGWGGGGGEEGGGAASGAVVGRAWGGCACGEAGHGSARQGFAGQWGAGALDVGWWRAVRVQGVSGGARGMRRRRDAGQRAVVARFRLGAPGAGTATAAHGKARPGMQ